MEKTSSETIRFTGARGGSGTTTIALIAAIARGATRIVGDVEDLRVICGATDNQLTDQLSIAGDYEPVAGLTIIDGGSIRHPYPSRTADNHSTIVIVRGPSYEALRTVRHTDQPDGIIVIHEPGRALRIDDVYTSLAPTPIIAELDLDPAIARANDAGLLLTRPPATVTQVANAISWDTP